MPCCALCSSSWPRRGLWTMDKGTCDHIWPKVHVSDCCSPGVRMCVEGVIFGCHLISYSQHSDQSKRKYQIDMNFEWGGSCARTIRLSYTPHHSVALRNISILSSAQSTRRQGGEGKQFIGCSLGTRLLTVAFLNLNMTAFNLSHPLPPKEDDH